MKKALISPNETVQYISGWELIGDKYFPIYSAIAERIAEICDAEFEIALPLFWVDCNDDVNTFEFYFDANKSAIQKIPDAPPIPE
jgi:hypothetical protein